MLKAQFSLSALPALALILIIYIFGIYPFISPFINGFTDGNPVTVFFISLLPIGFLAAIIGLAK